MKTQLAWHCLSTAAVIEKLSSQMNTGLSLQEIESRLEKWGPNSLPEPKQRSLLSIVMHQFLSPLIYLLLGAAVVAVAIGDVKDAIVILVVVLLNAVVGAFQEGRAEQSLRALRKLSILKTRVLRNNQEQIVEARELVPGDIILLSAGDAVPADARLIEAAALSVAESALTGESLPIAKSLEPVLEATPLSDRKNMIYAGTHITAGRGKAVVVATGAENEIGHIAKLATSTVQPKTQLEIRVEQFGRQLVIAAIIIFVLVVGIGLIRDISFSEIFLIAISQMVSVVPEGLPVALTVALAVGVQRMSRKGTIVRRLAAVETLGSVDVICTDKTGTLTRNEMVVTSIFLSAEKKEVKVSGIGYNPDGQFTSAEEILSIKPASTLSKILEAAVLCNDAQLLGPDQAQNRWRIVGDPTEGALLVMGVKGGIDLAAIKKSFPRKAEIPFDSDSKMMATQHEHASGSLVFVKGAPEAVIDLCGFVYAQGATQKLDDETRLATQNAAQKMADGSLRILAFAFIDNAFVDGSKGFKAFDRRLTLLGLIGELDPPREEVAAAVKDCQEAGIKAVMVTGDHKATGLAIAKSLGISSDHDLAIDGIELDQMSDQQLQEKLDSISVFARVHPAQKLRIVDAYQMKGRTVAMTGDGVNDAPALVKANVGVAMGITGTEVAKEAAKLVITDDNFATIVTAVSEGRLVYQNIKKLILFLFVTSLDEVIVLFLALVFGYPPPLAAVQILWINLVTEGTLTINLILDPPEGDEMKRAPISRHVPLLDKELLARVPLMTAASVISTFGWFLYRTSQGATTAQVQTETFTVLAVCQWFNVLNCRSKIKSVFKMDLLKNPWLLFGILLANFLHLAVIYTPLLNEFFHTVPIDLNHFLQIGVVASLVLWAEELRKWLKRRRIS